MERKEVKHYIDHMDANGLVNLCKDINEWKYKSGKLSPDCTLNHLAENLQYWELRDLEAMILDEYLPQDAEKWDAAYEKFGDIVSLLIKSDASRFLK